MKLGSRQATETAPAVLRSDDETRVIAINLPAGKALQEHQVHERAYLVVVDGEVEVRDKADAITASAGISLAIETKVSRVRK